MFAAQLGDLVTPMLMSGLPVEEYRTPAAASARVLDRRIRDQDHVGSAEDSLTAALIRDWMAAADSLALVLAQIDGLGDELRAEAAATVSATATPISATS
jgi:hypothetical protein